MGERARPLVLPPPLVMRCGALGDMVLVTVLLGQLHARFGTPVDLICSGRWVASLLAGQSSLGRLFVLGSRRTPYWLSPSQRELVAWLKSRGPGPTWFCDMGAGRELLARGGIPEDHVCDSTRFPWLAGESFADRYLRLGGWTPPAFEGRLPPSAPGVERAARLLVSPVARRTVQTLLEKLQLAGPFIVMHPGCRHATRRRLRSRSGTSKYWPEERWVQVLRGVRERCPEHAVLFTGTRPESRLNADIIARAQLADVHNVAGQLSLPELIALLAQASSVISVDTGPAHAAAALGRPTVALFGTADPELYRPGGATTPAVALTGRIDSTRNILGVTPDSVIAAWCELTRGEEGTGAPGTPTRVCSA